MEDPRLTKEDYWEAVKNQNLMPNFWMTDEYIEKAGLIWHEDEETKYCGWLHPEYNTEICPKHSEWMFPPMTYKRHFVLMGNVYSGFPKNPCMNYESNEEFLDYQYIYNPVDFMFLAGHKWKAFRKILRQYRERVDGKQKYMKIASDTFQDAIAKLLLKWAGEKEFFDNEVMIKYALEGENRWGMFTDEKLVGLNIWDENFMFVNYRYCIDDGTPGLNRYLRYHFYTQGAIPSKQKLINDGGSLGDEGLREFKLRLNPHVVYTVTSYKQEKP